MVPDSVPAGAFGAWLSEARASLRGEGGAEVPCGDCVGCCVSSYRIPLRPEDRAVMECIPDRHLVSTRGGQWMMGFRADGSCPMFAAGRCSIYASRPQTCRDYDCRVFAAAGIEAGGQDKAVINQRVHEWRFEYPSSADRLAHAAVQSAAAFIQLKRNSFPSGWAPTAPTGIAVLALKTYAVFLDASVESPSDADIACAIMEASRRFDAARNATPQEEPSP